MASWKGRGAVNRPTARFLSTDTEIHFEDGIDASAENPLSRYYPEKSKTVIVHNQSPDVPFDLSLNPFRGCEHGCVYCYARPSHAYADLSPGIDFETKIFYKPDAPQTLEKDLARRGYTCSPIAVGGNTDVYQPIERKLKITRGILEVLRNHSHPFTVITKSGLILRDLDILKQMAGKNLVRAFISITTLNADLASKMEPRAASPANRLKTLESLARAGVPVGLMIAPVIPGLTEMELERICEAAANAGASTAGMIMLRLPYEVKEIFFAWVRERFPARENKILEAIRGMRQGKLNDTEFGTRMKGSGPFAELIARRFELAKRKHGLNRILPELDRTKFQPPLPHGQARLDFG